MDRELLNYVKEQTEALIAAPSACKEVKAAAEKWLSAIGTESEKAETEAYLKELEEDIEPIDQLLVFLRSPLAAEYLGEEIAKAFLERSIKRQAEGEKYCDCPACAACANILARKENILR